MPTAATKFRIDVSIHNLLQDSKWAKAAGSGAEGSHSSRAGIPGISGETQ
jgi:hypothetical protein